MKFLLDENLGKSLALFLTQLGHTALRIKKIYPGAEDFEVLDLAVEKNAVLVTLDKDFGELVFKKEKTHAGIIFLRLEDQTLLNTKRVVKWLLSKFKDKIVNSFTTVIEKGGKLEARFRKKK